MKNILSTKNTIYVVLAVSTLLLSSLLVAPAIQKSATQVQAQSSWNAYLTLDGVQGSGDGSNNIEILSWSWGATQTGTYSGSGGGSGKVSMQDFHFTKRLDKASPMLYSLAKGKHIKNGTITVTDGSDSFKIEVSDVVVKSYGLSSNGGDRPTESLSLNFAKMTVSYDLKAAKK